MEVSSHSLVQKRVEYVDFNGAIFTNLTQDHLDFHITMENYFKAKAKLFADLVTGDFAIINNDDAYAEKFFSISTARRTAGHSAFPAPCDGDIASVTCAHAARGLRCDGAKHCATCDVTSCGQ